MSGWVVFAERESGYNSIVRSGFKTSREADAARREIEFRANEDDTTNYLVLPSTIAAKRETR